MPTPRKKAKKLVREKLSEVSQPVAKSTDETLDYSLPVNQDIRRALVFQLTLKGLSQERIGVALEVSRRTIERDQLHNREQMRLRNKKLKKNVDTDLFWQEWYEETQMMKSEAHTMYAAQRANSVHAGEFLIALHDEMTKTLRRIGWDINEPKENVEKVFVYVDPGTQITPHDLK